MNSAAQPEPSPTTVHTLLLANGRKIIVKFHFDPQLLSLCRVEEVKDLEELGINFDILVQQRLHLTWDIDFEDRIQKYQLFGARFRIGPTLAMLAGESRVICQGDERLAEEAAVNPIRIEAKITAEPIPLDEYYDVLVPDDMAQFFMISGRRACDVKPGERPPELPGINHTYFVSEEILALHSRYFYNIFYGDFSERSRSSYRLPDFTENTIITALRYAVSSQRANNEMIDVIQRIADDYSDSGRRANSCLRRVLQPEYRRVLEFFDRYSFVDALARARVHARALVDGAWLVSNKYALEIVDFLEEDDVTVRFLDEFVLIECLHEMLTGGIDVISRGTVLKLTQRMTDVSRLLHLRPKVRLVFAEGEVVCALFNDAHPRAVQTLIEIVRSGDFRRLQLQRGEVSVDLFRLERSIHHTDFNHVRSYVAPAYHFLTYQKFGEVSYLALADGSYGASLGNVVSGAELIPTLTKVRSLSIV